MPDTELTMLRHDGAGGARVEGGDLRVPGGLPGDVVRWTAVERKGRTTTARLDAILTPSPDRRAPSCPWDAACGGCDLAALRPATRHAALAEHVARAFGLANPVPLHAAPADTDHRARITLTLARGAIGYRGARSHDLVEIGTCGIARPEIQAALPALREVVAQVADPALRQVELRSDGRRVVFAFRTEGALRDGTSDALAALGDVAVDGRARHGDPFLWIPVGARTLRASPGVFYQVHLEQNAVLVDRVVSAVRAVQAERVLDLYAGIGNLSLPLAAAGVPVVAVEQAGAAIRDLRTTAARDGLIDRVTAVAVDAARYDVATHPFDVAILDPPRAGAGEVFGRVVALRPRRIVYVACHAPSAARDVRAHALPAGYRLTSVEAVDLFPPTHHVEAVVVLDRG